ncbi:efflux RND transporter periplasmic adaptor subunit [Thiocapsa roseopersicina]|uniref:RND family efflux transporter, MFP subunit n=1 Tax=Thiocapsa roseopersicina TaxID=1058 RepID=A0A1H2UEP7_THIRO|nr:efflux RND transporter periplasmic adaptor subunit [Thiocapsa roseopersicina]SDW54388.1 RND family efflux transporter, MFP subunit [Thiocapsa roseopersicina]
MFNSLPLSNARILAAAFMAATLAGCQENVPPTAQPRPVRTVTVEHGAEGETVSLSGQVQAKDHVGLAFRLDGHMTERPVNVGDVLEAGQVVARLDPRIEENTLRSAQANLASAEALLTETRLTFERHEKLLKTGATSRDAYDKALQAMLGAQGQVDSARAQVGIAQENLGYTVLSADAPGQVTAVGAEPGEVVRAGQTIVALARQGGRDAVFDVPERLIRTGPRDPVVDITLNDDPEVKATGRVREQAPQANPATRTFEVKVGLIDPPEAMQLGSTVTGRIRLTAPPGVEVPASALTESEAGPAVWVVDPHERSVSLRPVKVLRYDVASVVVSEGLERGDVVVTAGVHVLHPGQKVSLSEPAP